MLAKKFGMTKTLTLAVLVLMTAKAYPQIGEKDFEKLDKLKTKYADTINSTRALSGNCTLTYSSDTLFRCIHLTIDGGATYLIDIVYKNDYRGYTEYKADYTGLVLFKCRDDGAGNPIFYMTVNKSTGERKYLGKIWKVVEIDEPSGQDYLKNFYDGRTIFFYQDGNITMTLNGENATGHYEIAKDSTRIFIDFHVERDSVGYSNHDSFDIKMIDDSKMIWTANWWNGSQPFIILEEIRK
jgi:hypothetical protein